MGKIIEDDKGIVEFENKIKASTFGHSAHVILPRELRGKEVEVHYKREGKKK